MNENRFVVSDGLRQKTAPRLPGKPADAGVAARNNRLFLGFVRTGSPWRDLPREFGNCNGSFKRFRRWAEKGVFESLFNAASGDLDLEYTLVDGAIVQVHQKAADAKGA